MLPSNVSLIPTRTGIKLNKKNSWTKGCTELSECTNGRCRQQR